MLAQIIQKSLEVNSMGFFSLKRKMREGRREGSLPILLSSKGRQRKGGREKGGKKQKQPHPESKMTS